MKVLIIDNNDSFTYNLAQMFQDRNDVSLDVLPYALLDIQSIKAYEKVLISPGPGLPSDFPKYFSWLPVLEKNSSILGICMGMEIIAEYYGARLLRQKRVQHGLKMKIRVSSTDSLFKNMDDHIEVGLYHSWIVDRNTLPEQLWVNAEDLSGKIMGLSHNEYDIKGVQFHPESYMTITGQQIIDNWLS